MNNLLLRQNAAGLPVFRAPTKFLGPTTIGGTIGSRFAYSLLQTSIDDGLPASEAGRRQTSRGLQRQMHVGSKVAKPLILFSSTGVSFCSARKLGRISPSSAAETVIFPKNSATLQYRYSIQRFQIGIFRFLENLLRQVTVFLSGVVA